MTDIMHRYVLTTDG